jgi:hypothetical protein
LDERESVAINPPFVLRCGKIVSVPPELYEIFSNSNHGPKAPSFPIAH